MPLCSAVVFGVHQEKVSLFLFFFSFFSTIFSIKHTVKRRLLPFFYRFLLRHMANFEEFAPFAVDFIFILWTFEHLAAKSKKNSSLFICF